MDFHNVYQDETRAEAYARLEFPGTYHLAFRDLPELLCAHTLGTRALDFGCGAGRSTRFLERLGFRATGVDVSCEMIRQARLRAPEADYRLLSDAGEPEFECGAFDLALCAFTFDNVPTLAEKVRLFSKLRAWTRASGRIVNLVSRPELYVREWASFSTRPFGSNRTARSGDRVYTVMKDVTDARPVEDVLCSDDDYRWVYEQAGLKVVSVTRPLATGDEPFAWESETSVAPWSIYLLAPAQHRSESLAPTTSAGTTPPSTEEARSTHH